MKKDTYIRKIGLILKQLDNGEIKDKIGINRLLRLNCKYINENVEKEIKSSEGENKQ